MNVTKKITFIAAGPPRPEGAAGPTPAEGANAAPTPSRLLYMTGGQKRVYTEVTRRQKKEVGMPAIATEERHLLRTALPVLAVGMGLIVLDGTIVGVTLPTIIRDLSLTLAQAEWVNAVYSVVFAALLLTCGRLGDMLGTRRVFSIGLALFVVGSIACACSRTAAPLIAARAFQGVGAACVLPSSLSAANNLFTGRSRPVAFGIWGATMSAAAALGPLIGGALTTYASWPWVFWVNVPIGVGVIVAAQALVPDLRRTSERRVDLFGLVLSIIGFGGLVFGIIEGPSLGWWRSAARAEWVIGTGMSPVPVALAVGLVAIALFLGWQRCEQVRGLAALLDLRLFRHQTFSWGNTAAFVIAAGEFALVFVLPLYLSAERELSAMGSGLVLAAMAGGAMASGASARHVAARLSPTGTVILGLILEVAGVVALSQIIRAGWALGWIVVALVVYGIGLGLASAQLTSTVLVDVEADRSGQGSATQSTVRQIGSACGVAAAGTLIAVVVPHQFDGLAAAARPSAQLVDALVSSGGGILPGLAAKAARGALGPDGVGMVARLADGYAAGIAWVVLLAGALMVVGLAAAIRLAVVTRASSRPSA